MSVFEFVFGLLSVIASLSLTHLVASLVALTRAQRVHLSAVHGLWVWTAFATTVGNWGASWPLRSLHAWPAWAVLIGLAVFIGQYAFCVLVMPAVIPSEEVDLREFHRRSRRRYIYAFMALDVVAVIGNIAFSGPSHYEQWVRDLWINVVYMALGLAALFARAAWIQLAVAALLAGMATWFMVLACNIAAA